MYLAATSFVEVHENARQILAGETTSDLQQGFLEPSKGQERTVVFGVVMDAIDYIRPWRPGVALGV